MRGRKGRGVGGGLKNEKGKKNWRHRSRQVGGGEHSVTSELQNKEASEDCFGGDDRPQGGEGKSLQPEPRTGKNRGDHGFGEGVQGQQRAKER